MEIINTNATIKVKEIESSVLFYQSIGFQLKQRWNDNYAMISAPGIEIGLHPSEQSAENQGSISIGFTTSDFKATENELAALGISVTKRTEEGGDFLHFNDPDGTPLYFINPKW